MADRVTLCPELRGEQSLQADAENQGPRLRASRRVDHDSCTGGISSTPRLQAHHEPKRIAGMDDGAEHPEHSLNIKLKRTIFFYIHKSKAGLILAKAAALRVNANLQLPEPFDPRSSACHSRL